MEPNTVDYLPTGGSLFRIIITTIILIVGIAIVIGGAERLKIMEQWGERRCEFFTMMSGFLYKPASYNGSATEFAVDNFNFCLGAMAKKTLTVETQPVLDTMRKQIDAQGTILGSQNRLRSSFSKVADTVNEKLSWFYDKYKQGIYLFSRIAQGVMSSLKRIVGMLTSLMYLMLSAYVGTMNTLDYAIYVAMVVAAILMAIPFANILTAFITIPTLAFTTTWRSMQERFYCFARGTPIMTVSGTTPVEQLEVGQTLIDGGVVEGMYTFNGLDTDLYLLNGVLVSGSHLVYGPRGLCAVQDHPDARPTTARSNLLYCPIISSRVVFTPGPNGATKFADWEEVSGAAEDDYDKEVRYMLGFKDPLTSCTLPSGLRGNTSVITKEHGLVLLSGVKIGDHILDADNKYSKVEGISRRTVNVDDTCATFTDGVIHYDFEEQAWKYLDSTLTTKSGPMAVDTYQLITNSGTYAVINDDGYAIVIRDATEVGIANIDKLTPLVLKHLNSENVKL